MFHAALITAVCLCVDPTSLDASIWTKDLDTTRASLSVEFSDNEVAPRCLEILDGLRPHVRSVGDGLHFMSSHGNAAAGDMRFWSLDVTDTLNPLTWPDLGLDFP